jgi:hypothetical protein
MDPNMSVPHEGAAPEPHTGFLETLVHKIIDPIKHLAESTYHAQEGNEVGEPSGSHVPVGASTTAQPEATEALGQEAAEKGVDALPELESVNQDQNVGTAVGAALEKKTASETVSSDVPTGVGANLAQLYAEIRNQASREASPDPGQSSAVEGMEVNQLLPQATTGSTIMVRLGFGTVDRYSLTINGYMITDKGSSWIEGCCRYADGNYRDDNDRANYHCRLGNRRQSCVALRRSCRTNGYR